MSFTLSYATPVVVDIPGTPTRYVSSWVPDWNAIPDAMVTLAVTFTAEYTGTPGDFVDDVRIFLGGTDVGDPGDAPADPDDPYAGSGHRLALVEISAAGPAEYTASITIPNPRGSVPLRALIQVTPDAAYPTGRTATLDSIDIVVSGAGDVMTYPTAWEIEEGVTGRYVETWRPDFTPITDATVALAVALHGGNDSSVDSDFVAIWLGGADAGYHGDLIVDPGTMVGTVVLGTASSAGPDAGSGTVTFPHPGPGFFAVRAILHCGTTDEPEATHHVTLFDIALTLSGGGDTGITLDGDCSLLTSTDDLDLSADGGNVSLYLRSFEVDLTPFAGVEQLALTLTSNGEAVSSGDDTEAEFLRVMASVGGTDGGALNDEVVDSGDTLLWVQIPQLEVTPKTAKATIANPGGTVTFRLWARSHFGGDVGTPTALIHGATLEICPSAGAPAPTGGLPPVDPILDELLGTDIDAAFDLPHSFVLASGLKNLGNAIVRRLSTPAGALAAFGDDPDYGYDLRGKLNASMPLGRIQALGAEVEAEILKDERIEAADVAVSFDLAASSLTVEIAMATALGPYRLVLAVTDRTIDIINA